MDSKILLGRILQRFIDEKAARVPGYQSFGFLRLRTESVLVTRERGKDTPVPFSAILTGINAYQQNAELYQQGPSALRAFGISHVTSPVFALLQLLEQKDYLINH